MKFSERGADEWGDRTGIEWTDATWNPIRGCSRVSDGCRHCYAELVAARFSGPGMPYEGLARMRSNGEPQWTGVVRVIEEHMNDPLRWRKPRRVFVNSMSDLFHEALATDDIIRVFAVMMLADRHQFQVLTKRPDRMRQLLSRDAIGDDVWLAAHAIVEAGGYREYDEQLLRHSEGPVWPLPNVWLGTSVENQSTADERIPQLIKTAAAVRFLSCEPLLDELFVGHWLTCRVRSDPQFEIGHGVDWVIVGGESGKGARPCDVTWIRSLIFQCRDAGSFSGFPVPVFVKQLGTRPTTSTRGSVELRDRKGGDPDEWPADLRVREFPREVVVHA